MQKIKHRGPDDSLAASVIDGKPILYSCTLSSEEAKNKFNFIDYSLRSPHWFGFNRLSIIDRSIHGMQPFYDASRNCSFLMNGEIYNYKELRKKWLSEEKFFSETDTEVAFKLYLKYGDDFVQYLRGMFVIVIIHHTENKIKVWRDRFGTKPFFYAITDDSFIFSSEINGILATQLIDGEIDFKNLAYQFYLGTSHAPATIYKKIKSVEPATQLIFSIDSFEIKTKRYWTLTYEPSNKLAGREEFFDDIKEVATVSLIGDDVVKKGLMLSGGIDSGTLAYLFKNKKVTAYTIYNEQNQHFNELPFAKLNAANAHLPVEAFEIPNHVSEETITDFCLAEEEPNTSPEPAYFLSKMVQGKCRILYNALGLDELFYGYSYHYQAKLLSKITKVPLPLLSALLRGNKRRKMEEILKFGLGAYPLISRSDAGWDAIKSLFGAYFNENWEHPVEVILRQVKSFFPELASLPILKQMAFLDFYYYISSHHSFRSDRPAMLNNIEMHFPFLDHLFVQKYFNLQGLEKGLAKNYNKPFLRRNIRSVVNPQVLNMPKKGFGMPAESWVNALSKDEILQHTSCLFGKKAVEEFATNAKRRWQLISLCAIYHQIS